MSYKIYSVKSYKISPTKIQPETFENIDDCVEALKKNAGYHLRPNTKADNTFFIDIDSKEEEVIMDLPKFIKFFKKFLKNQYEFKLREWSYTINNKKEGSYHVVFPELHGLLSDMLKLILEFKKQHEEYNDDRIDESIYKSERWFRLPNQSNESKQNLHKIEVGEMKDFVLSYIHENSTNIKAFF
jgi:hypothetical protein